MAAATAAASGNAAAAATAATALASSSPLLDAGELSHQFDDVVSRVVRCLIRTNESRATLYELELRKALQHSQMSGWNFCAFFVLKVSQALHAARAGSGSISIGMCDAILLTGCHLVCPLCLACIVLMCTCAGKLRLLASANGSEERRAALVRRASCGDGRHAFHDCAAQKDFALLARQHP
jgi:hypothetical protein